MTETEATNLGPSVSLFFKISNVVGFATKNRSGRSIGNKEYNTAIREIINLYLINFVKYISLYRKARIFAGDN